MYFLWVDEWCHRLWAALGLLCKPGHLWILFCPQPCVGCVERVSRTDTHPVLLYTILMCTCSEFAVGCVVVQESVTCKLFQELIEKCSGAIYEELKMILSFRFGDAVTSGQHRQMVFHTCHFDMSQICLHWPLCDLIFLVERLPNLQNKPTNTRQ